VNGTHLLALGASLFLAVACARPSTLVPAPLSCPHGHGSLLRDGLYFGLTEPDGREISDSTWESFLANEVTPRFASGFTVLSARGQWQLATGQVMREPSRVLVLFHPASASADSNIRAIIQRYRTDFHQEAVLWERSLACAAF
jgi:hypothetical protein